MSAADVWMTLPNCSSFGAETQRLVYPSFMSLSWQYVCSSRVMSFLFYYSQQTQLSVGCSVEVQHIELTSVHQIHYWTAVNKMYWTTAEQPQKQGVEYCRYSTKHLERGYCMTFVKHYLLSSKLASLVVEDALWARTWYFLAEASLPAWT